MGDQSPIKELPWQPGIERAIRIGGGDPIKITSLREVKRIPGSAYGGDEEHELSLKLVPQITAELEALPFRIGATDKEQFGTMSRKSHPADVSFSPRIVSVNAPEEEKSQSMLAFRFREPKAAEYTLSLLTNNNLRVRKETFGDGRSATVVRFSPGAPIKLLDKKIGEICLVFPLEESGKS